VATFIYDLKNQPLTFDFASFLAFIHLVMKNKKNKASLLILADEIRKIYPTELLNTNDMDRWRIENIVLPLAANCTHISTVNIFYEKLENIGLKVIWPPNFDITSRNSAPPMALSVNSPTTHDLWSLSQKLLTHPGFFRESEKFKEYVSAVSQQQTFATVTTRFSETSPDRNTTREQLEATFRAIANVYAKEVMILVIGDQDGDLPTWVDDLISSYGNAAKCELADWNVSVRFEFYRRATFNITWNTGPASLLFYHTFPYLILGTYTSTSPVSNMDFLRRKGPKYGEQSPWSRQPEQLIDWTDSIELNYDNTYDVVNKFISKLSVEVK
jgi:hypothetical protein